MDMSEFDDYSDGEETFPVVGPSGASYSVIHPVEVTYWNDISERYLHDYRFTNMSDLQDLERILTMELISYRYQQWVSTESDYDGNPVDVEELNKNIRELSKENRLVKKALGMDKSSRDKDRGENAAAYIESLRHRAHQFGVMRNEQAVKAITLFMELKSLVTFHDNCTEEERREQHIQIEDLLDWIRMVIPEFDAIDEKFRQEGDDAQKYWIGDM